MSPRGLETRADPLFADIDKLHPPATALTLGEAVKRYVNDTQRSNVSIKTRAAWGFRFGAWVDLLGNDAPVSDITRDDIWNALDTLLVVPQNASKRFPKMSLREIAKKIAKLDLPRLAPKSIRLYIDVLTSLFRYLLDEQVLTRNLALGLKGPRRDDEDEGRRPWTMDELNAFFSMPPYDKPWQAAGKSWHYWLPLIALFSGARQGELVGLKRADRVEIEGLSFLRIQSNETRGLKTRQSKRLLPIHPMLVDFGLLKFIYRSPVDGFIFPDLPKTKLGPVHAVQKSLGRRVRTLISDRDLVFHSFRHNFRDAMREANIPDEVAGALGGWTHKDRSSMAVCAVPATP